MISYILAVICGIVVFVLDRITKIYIVSNFSLYDQADFLKGFVDIVYIHNRGGAWGMLSDRRWILLTVSAVVMVVCLVVLIKYALKSKLLFWAIVLVIFGGLGNMVDRIFRDGNVIDFLHFEFWPDFPVFNVADCAIVVGAGLLILYFVLDAIKDMKLKKQGQDNG